MKLVFWKQGSMNRNEWKVMIMHILILIFQVYALDCDISPQQFGAHSTFQVTSQSHSHIITFGRPLVARS